MIFTILLSEWIITLLKIGYTFPETEHGYGYEWILRYKFFIAYKLPDFNTVFNAIENFRISFEKSIF